MTKSIPRIIISKLIGFLIFLILLAVANILIPYINSGIYTSFVEFFNANITILAIITLIGLVNGVFWSFYFPFNTIAPLISAILSMYIITFIYRFWTLLDKYTGLNVSITSPIFPIYLIYILVFFIVLISGYITILARHGKPKGEWEERWENKLERKKERLERKIDKIDRKMRRKGVEWDEIGDEFKLFFYNIGKGLNSLFKKNKK
jgi:predicted PurR-regulated permease PerM